MTDQPESTDFSAMAAPTDEHALLKPFVGTFDAEVSLWMGPGDPHVMTGTMKNAFDLGGRFLHQVYEGDAEDGPFPAFQGRGYWGYNTIDGRWEGFWIDTASTVQQIEHGSVDEDGKVWTMVGEMTDPGSGQPTTKRSVITLVDDDHHTLEMYFGTPEGESKGMAIEYVRRPDKKAEYVAALSARLDELRELVAKAESRVGEATGPARAKLEEQIATAKKGLDVGKVKMAEMRNSGEESFGRLKGEADHVWKTFRSSVRYFRSQL